MIVKLGNAWRNCQNTFLNLEMTKPVSCNDELSEKNTTLLFPFNRKLNEENDEIQLRIYNGTEITYGTDYLITIKIQKFFQNSQIKQTALGLSYKTGLF